jgi:hypothetical protein
MYTYLSQTMNQISDFNKQQVVLLDEDIREYLSYIKKEFKSYKEVIILKFNF